MTKAYAHTALGTAVAALAVSLAGCSSLHESEGPVDYRDGARKTVPLEVPPDLTPLARDSRYQPQSGSVSASTLGKTPHQVAQAASAVALSQAGDLRIERQGELRWLVSRRSAEVLWPQVRQFWLDQGFTLLADNAQAGLLETDWAENRAKLPKDLLRRTLGRLLDRLYSTSERDRYRIRLERLADGGTEITVAHRGLQEVYDGKERDTTLWVARPSDPGLEAEMLSLLMISLGNTADSARAAVAASAPALAGRARMVAAPQGNGSQLEVDEPLERAWRRVGLSLDRGGFTVEERDRTQGLYFVRYVDPKDAGREGNFFTRLFGMEDPAIKALGRYRIALKATGNTTQISVLDNQGQPDVSVNAQRIATLLVDELK